jgi:hypothetical protein
MTRRACGVNRRKWGRPRSDARLGVGDTVFFPSGSSAEWIVEKHVTKIAFCRKPLPRYFEAARLGYRAIKRAAKLVLLRREKETDSVPSMFGGA